MTPERESRPAGNQAATSSTKNGPHRNSHRAYRPGSAAASRWPERRRQLDRRRAAARRLQPLDCGCPDPWPCGCADPPLSNRMIDGGRDAALHLLQSGQVPLLQIEVLQALWRRGGLDRELAEHLHAEAGGDIA